MKKIIFISFLALIALGAMANGPIDTLQASKQPSSVSIVDSLEKPVLMPTSAPVFMLDSMGCAIGFSQWIVQNVSYPPMAAEDGIQGRVYVSFIIEKDGTMSNVKLERGADSYLDEEAISLIKRAPKWHQPAIGAEGKPVRMRFYIPVDFILYQ